MAEAGDRSERDRAGIGPDPEAEHARDLIPLDDMEGYSVASGDPDIRGWNVRTRSGRDLGEVDNLLVDRDRREVVMVDVELRDGGAHAEVPIRSVQFDRQRRNVIVDDADLIRRESRTGEVRRGESRGDIRSDVRSAGSDAESAASFGARGSQRADLPGPTARETTMSAVAGTGAAAASLGRRKSTVDETVRRTAAEHVREERDEPNGHDPEESRERSFSESTRQSMPRTDESQQRPAQKHPRGIPQTEESRRTSEGMRQSMSRNDDMGSSQSSSGFSQRRPPDGGQ